MVVIISPTDVVSVPGGRAIFLCMSSAPFSNGGIRRFQWLLNDTLLEDFGISNVEMSVLEVNGGIGTLTFSNVSQHLNMTRIKCIIEFRSGHEMGSASAVLLVQGKAALCNNKSLAYNS